MANMMPPGDAAPGQPSFGHAAPGQPPFGHAVAGQPPFGPAVGTVYRSSQPPPRRRRRWLLWSVLLPLLVLLAGGGYAVEPLRHDLPRPTAAVTVPMSYEIPGTAPVWPWPATGQAVVEVDGLGRIGASGGDAAKPIASVAKVMTAYVILVDHPLAVGEPGPALKITAQQADAYAQQAARGESLVKVAAGASFTEREALQAVLLPSANNMARILAAWDAGSEAAFVTRMNETAATLGMAVTRYTDPAGYDAGTVSSASDQVILARKAMALPAFAEIVAQTRATLPVAGTVVNYNTMVGQDGVVGIKTGSTDEAGGCLSFAAKITVGGREIMIFGAVLGQPGSATPQQLQSVFVATRALIRAVGKALVLHTVIHAGEQIAAVTGPLDTGTTLSAAQDVSLLGWPGMKIQLTAQIPRVPARLVAGASHGAITLVGGETTAGTTLTSGVRLEPPSTWTRIQRHRGPAGGRRRQDRRLRPDRPRPWGTSRRTVLRRARSPTHQGCTASGIRVVGSSTSARPRACASACTHTSRTW